VQFLIFSLCEPGNRFKLLWQKNRTVSPPITNLLHCHANMVNMTIHYKPLLSHAGRARLEGGMNRSIQVVIMVLFSLFVSGSLHSSPVQAAEKKAKERLAVLDLEAKYGIDKGLAEALSGIVRDRIHSYGEFQVMSKEDIQAVASREQLKQALGCDDGSSQCLVEFGRMIGTRFMVAGDISKIGTTYTVSLRMMDTQGEGAGVTNRVRESCKCNDDALIGTVEDLAAKLLGKPSSAVAKKTDDAETKRLAEEKKKTTEAEQKRIAEERRKADEEKQKLAAENERLKKEKVAIDVERNQLTEEKKKKEENDKLLALEKKKAAEIEQKRLAELLKKEDEATQKNIAAKKADEERQKMPAKTAKITTENQGQDAITKNGNPAGQDLHKRSIALVKCRFEGYGEVKKIEIINRVISSINRNSGKFMLKHSAYNLANGSAGITNTPKNNYNFWVKQSIFSDYSPDINILSDCADNLDVDLILLFNFEYSWIGNVGHATFRAYLFDRKDKFLYEKTRRESQYDIYDSARVAEQLTEGLFYDFANKRL
jgi:hypothetical protein